ncbi:hypothetical protein [Bradyrhizobium japonicum]|uniref:hypothetical protein n=1 Tax=Bradyrhizobium japonicum TaxID=375 RepID=UPI001E4E8997|nr:hypothetical protein [Bradyrhizobium japonicum]MCD9892076.1 hypothetical protein [Bradyrhizobium japonicum]WRJ83894.1 hypothetical protein R3F78_02925 [Bradyrhizobium japonicum]WRJ92863.1 hypothetical protein R3F77_00640 [Bradyrhizobium japonicum]WRK46714.1 hypothetical protein R3F73_00695 [Bradyrhizobium japonicum]
MPYRVEQENGLKSSEVEGILVVLPFQIDKETAQLTLQPDLATAAVHILYDRSERQAFPQVTKKVVPGASKFMFKDGAGKIRISLDNFSLGYAIPGQAVDKGETLWLLKGTRSTGCQLAYNRPDLKFFDDLTADAKEHYYWRGRLECDGVQAIKLSYFRSVYNFADQYYENLFAFGPTCEGGSMFNCIVDQGKWMREDDHQKPIYSPAATLNEIRFVDGRRGQSATSKFGGEQGKAQMLDSSGSVFLAEGSFASLTPNSLQSLVRSSLNGPMALRDALQTAELQVIPQNALDTIKPLTPAPETDTGKSAMTLEGLCLENLKPRTQDALFL